MMFLRFKALLVLLALAVLAGCANNTGQYQTPARGGWDNFRADAAPGQPSASFHRTPALT
jgi:hypothetical protein